MSVIADLVCQLGLIGYSDAEADFMYTTMETVQPDIVCEWGTNVGESARVFHECRRLLSLLGCAIHSIDSTADVPILRPEDKGKTRGHWVEGLDVTLHVGDGCETALHLYLNGPYAHPLFFSDDSHLQAPLLVDLEAIAAFAPEGVILVHDANVAGEDAGNAAVRAFTRTHPEWSWLDGPGMVRLWVT